MNRRSALVALSLVLVASCETKERAQPTGQDKDANATPKDKGTLALGEPIKARPVPLAELAKSPSRYENQLVATSGKVTAVCQAMGCWMELQDESGQAHVRMHGHTFFVPKTAAGHFARVQATVLPSGNEHCEDSPPPSTAMAKVELDATGIELD